MSPINKIRAVEVIVANYFEVSMEDLLSRKKSRPFVDCRQTLWYILKKHLKVGPVMSANRYNRTHGNVSTGISHFESLIEADEQMKESLIEIEKKIAIILAN